MATYIVLGSYTEQGIKTLKDLGARLSASRQLAQSLGASVKEYYLTFGQYDFVVVFEAPSDEAAARLVISVATQGNVRTQTLKAFPEPEALQLVQGLP